MALMLSAQVACCIVKDHDDVLIGVFALESREEGALGVAVHGFEADEVEALSRERRDCREERTGRVAHLLWEHGPPPYLRPAPAKIALDAATSKHVAASIPSVHKMLYPRRH